MILVINFNQGAQWLHGADKNPLYKWLSDEDMLDDYEDGSAGFKGLFCSSGSTEVSQNLVMKVLDIVMESRVALSEYGYAHTGLNNAAEVFRHQLELKISQDEKLLENRDLVFVIFDWFLRYEAVENGCDSMEDVSIASYTDWTDWGDGSLLNFKLGYRSLLQWFCSQFPAKKWIQLNRQVTKIEMLKQNGTGSWCNDDGLAFKRPILVKYSSLIKTARLNSKRHSTSISGVIECNHVIMTASLGFLKQNHESLFKPPLPDTKRELIQSIGFGTVNKIVLQFERPFWKNEHGIKLVWNESDRTKFPGWAQDIIAFDIVRRQPNLLIGWIGGLGAKLMEKESDMAIAETCLAVLEQFLPASIDRPSRLVNCICSRWNSNPFVCGSYSYLSMGSFGQNVERLHEPVCEPGCESSKLSASSTARIPRVLFAGEATAGKLYSTTHGAVISGWREADRLRDHLSNELQSNVHPIAVGGRSVSASSQGEIPVE